MREERGEREEREIVKEREREIGKEREQQLFEQLFLLNSVKAKLQASRIK